MEHEAGNNEVAAVQDDAVQAVEPQSLTMSPTEETGYAYTREDGTVERASSAKEAFARCPVLGKLAVEAPEEADMLLQLHALGSQKMAAEDVSTKTNQNTKTTSVWSESTSKSENRERKPSVPDTRESSLSESPAVSEDVEAGTEFTATTQSAPAQKQYPKETHPEGKTSGGLAGMAGTDAAKKSAAKKTQANQAKPALKQPNPLKPAQKHAHRKDKTLGGSAGSSVASSEGAVTKTGAAKGRGDTLSQNTQNHGFAAAAHAVAYGERLYGEAGNAEPEPLPISLSEQENSETDEERLRRLSDESAEHVPMESAEAAAHELLSDAQEIVFADQTDETFVELSDEAEVTHEPTGATASREVYDVAEVLETFEELSEIIALQREESPTAAEPRSETNGEAEVSEAETEAAPEAHVFEAYLAAQPLVEAPENIEAVQEHVNEQPLEQTFVELAALLSESDDEQPIPENLINAFDEVEEMLRTHYEPNDNEASPAPAELSPEMVEAFITLLRELGCQDPKEALTGIVTRHGLDFLLETLGYLSQLRYESNRKEFLPNKRKYAANDDSDDIPVRLRVAKFVFGLIARSAHSQELAV